MVRDIEDYRRDVEEMVEGGALFDAPNGLAPVDGVRGELDLIRHAVEAEDARGELTDDFIEGAFTVVAAMEYALYQSVEPCPTCAEEGQTAECFVPVHRYGSQGEPDFYACTNCRQLRDPSEVPEP